ncbi:RNA ligase [Pseudomonas phage vB_PF_Y1-MI]|nr:RNA ligase [Pseudomonas phage vB_PF_Y1-MI]
MTVIHTERALARVVLIDSLHPIEGADRIELAMVGGWQVVVQKGLYVPGSKAVYFEVDSLLPLDRPCFESLGGVSSKLKFTIDDKPYARIKTMKLRKQLSQGFCVPLSEAGVGADVAIDTDVTKLLGVIKYEAAGEKALNGTPGNPKAGTSALGFPKFVPKTDQTRVQNITVQFAQARDKGELFEKSFKLDGSSLTAFVKDGVVGVASRNVGFRVKDEVIPFFTAVKKFLQGKGWKRTIKADDNAFTQMAEKAGLLTALLNDGRNIAIQGEMVGPSIQKNFEGVTENEFYCYDIYLIDEQRYMLPKERQEFCVEHGVQHVPLASSHAVTLPVDVATAIADADGPSGLNGKMREGFVYKSMSRDFSFKVISNSYLLAED